jgi:phosphatidylserine/phosphatidylglycerophosphate/cardiolipin synthase-like enzyme
VPAPRSPGCCARRHGPVVYGLMWRFHLDRLNFSERENRRLCADIAAAGGTSLRDQRMRPGGSHHQKFVVLRHPGRPELDVAFVGGIDLYHGRHDDAAHAGDKQAQPMAAVYGDRPPWHDIQVAIHGPAVGDVEAIFRERWEDPAPLTRNPVHRLRALLHQRGHPGLPRCRRSCPIRRRAVHTPCSCCGHIPTAAAARSSPRTASAAISRCSAGPDP